MAKGLDAKPAFWRGPCGFRVFSERPSGRHVAPEIAVEDRHPVPAASAVLPWPLSMEPEAKTHRAGGAGVATRRFFVQDPDGHLPRCSQGIG